MNFWESWGAEVDSNDGDSDISDDNDIDVSLVTIMIILYATQRVFLGWHPLIFNNLTA